MGFSFIVVHMGLEVWSFSSGAFVTRRRRVGMLEVLHTNVDTHSSFLPRV